MTASASASLDDSVSFFQSKLTWLSSARREARSRWFTVSWSSWVLVEALNPFSNSSRAAFSDFVYDSSVDNWSSSNFNVSFLICSCDLFSSFPSLQFVLLEAVRSRACKFVTTELFSSEDFFSRFTSSFKSQISRSAEMYFSLSASIVDFPDNFRASSSSLTSEIASSFDWILPRASLCCTWRLVKSPSFNRKSSLRRETSSTKRSSVSSFVVCPSVLINSSFCVRFGFPWLWLSVDFVSPVVEACKASNDNEASNDDASWAKLENIPFLLNFFRNYYTA